MVAAARRVLLSLVVAGALVFGVTSAAAGPNLVPNGSFTNNCSGVPCQWSTNTASTTLSWDTASFHSAPASLGISAGSPNSGAAALSDCFALSPSTQYDLAGWYSTTSTNVSAIHLQLEEFSDGACGSFVKQDQVSASPIVTTGAWTALQAQPTTDSATHSAWARVDNTPVDSLNAARFVAYDDVSVSLGLGPLAATVASFTALRTANGVLLRWRTGTEANQLGFNVYRQEGTRRVRVNARLLPALGGLAGSSYSYRDRRAPATRSLRYWLQDVAVDGTRAWHGPLSVSGA